MKKRKSKTKINLFHPPPLTELTAIFRKEIAKVKFTADEKRAYFEELYNILKQTEWKHLQPWAKTDFFKCWFAAISDDLLKASCKYELLKNQYLIKKKVTKKLDPLDMIRFLNEEQSKSGELLDSIILLFGIWLEKYYLDFSLRKGFSREFLRSLFGDGEDSIGWYNTMPVKKMDSFKEIDNLENISFRNAIERHGPRTKDALKILLIDIKPHTKTLLKQVEKIIEKEKQKYFEKYPEDKGLFVKKTKDGRDDTYPFDEWRRYLEVYILKQLGKTNRELAEQFYNKSNEKTIRQILRDNQKAKKLSINAVNINFPGTY